MTFVPSLPRVPARFMPTRPAVLTAALTTMVLMVSSLPVASAATSPAPGSAAHSGGGVDGLDGGAAGTRADEARVRVTPEQRREAARQRAATRAHETGQAVRVPELSGETQNTFIQPDGTMSSQIFAGAVNVDRDGGWYQADTTLQTTPLGVQPGSVRGDVVLSGGGTAPLARVGTQGRSFSLTWPRPLPAPELSGSRAIYREVAPGQNLVVEQGIEGLEVNVVLRDQGAARTPVELGVSSDDLTVVEDTGGLRLRDDAGAAIVSSPPAYAYDNAVQPPVGTTVGQSGVGHNKRLKVTVTKHRDLQGGRDHSATLTLLPDPGVLADPTTVYPLTLDPGWTWARPGYGDETYITSAEPGYGHNGLGWVDVGTIGNGQIARTFMYFNVADWVRRGVRVNNAYVNAVNYRTTTCSPSPVPTWVGRINSPWDGNVNWYNGQLNISWLWSSNDAHGMCDGENWVGWYVRDTVQAWFDGSQPVYGLALAAGNESDGRGFREYRATEVPGCCAQPYLWVDYTPAPPSAPTMTGATPGDGQVTVSWNASDASPYRRPLSYYVDVFDANDAYMGYAAVVDAGQPTTATVRCVNTGACLQNGGTYYFRVNANNEGGWSGYAGRAGPVTPRAVPTAASVTGVYSGDAQLAVTWTVSAQGNDRRPLRYFVDVFDASDTYLGYQVAEGAGASSATVTSITNPGTGAVTPVRNGVAYYVRINAFNETGYAGYGTRGGPATPYGLPGSPASVTTSAGDRQATASWTAPQDNGGAAVDFYDVYIYDADASNAQAGYAQINATSRAFAGLSVGHRYWARVYAHNARGSGPPRDNAGNPSAPVYGPPKAPALSGIDCDRCARLSWGVPDEQYSTVTGYTLTRKDVATGGRVPAAV